MIDQLSRVVAGYAADIGGVLRAGRWPSNFPAVFMYHHAGSKEGNVGPEAYTVSPTQLAADLERLTTHATVVPMDRLIDWLTGDATLPPDAVVVTFDDGYRDVDSTVVPLLERFETPATVYVSTGCVADRKSPFAFRLLDALRRRDHVSIQLADSRIKTDVSTTGDLQTVYDRLYTASKWATPEERSRLLDRLGADDPEPIPMLRPEEVASLSASELVTVGSHGHRHVPLAGYDESTVRRDLEEADRLLTEWTGTTPDHFSYPYGSAGPAVRRVVARRYASAVGTDARRVRPRDWRRPHELPRFDGADRAWPDDVGLE